ncbi:MAG: hypothetical protein GXY86_13730 [Firmicutes bacterium]|nr:hypothetical protein [Bacillota bacterium]
MENWNLVRDTGLMKLFSTLPVAFFQKERWFADRNCQLELVLADSIQFIRTSPHQPVLTFNLFQTRPFHGYYYYLPLLITQNRIGDQEALFEKNSYFFYDAIPTYEYVTLTEDFIQNQAVFSAAHGSFQFQSFSSEVNRPRVRLQGSTSNSLLFVAREYLLKNYRRIYPGVNPELKISTSLAGVDSKQIPEIYGSINYHQSDSDYTLGIIMETVENFGTGWERWGRLVKELSSENEQLLQDEAELLGRALGVFHGELGTIAKKSGEFLCFEGTDLEERVDNISNNLRELVSLPETQSIVAKLKDVKKGLFQKKLGAKFRIHGDLHLEQVIKTGAGWRFLDLEGEPLKPIPERENYDSPLKDLASMLRSISYRFCGEAANNRGIEGKISSALTEGYLDGCREVKADFLPETAEFQWLLILFQIERAAYECLYELKYRPDWLWIPQSGLADLARRL